MENKPAILVENISASYGSVSCCLNVSLDVERGSIYALLGPSGCGKTTLLSCILGRKKIESGVILVNNHKPGDRSNGLPGSLVGYMPQDISLYMEFTVAESFQFFGRLHKMTSQLVKDRQKDISEMLELPEGDRKVQAMSGGQRRRLSFALALLHHPEILILDEPTVGVDPLVRARIWNHLEILSKNGVTTMITTHHIEEARKSNTVGIMRKGKLLAQDTPSELMQQYKASSLEAAFLHICQHDLSGKDLSTPQEDTNTNIVHHKNWRLFSKALTKLSSKELTKGSFNIPSASNIFALTMKNLIGIKRNLPILFFMFIAPALFMVLSCVSIGNSPRNIPIGLVNFESNCSDEIFTKSCQANLLSCYLEQSLNGTDGLNLQKFSNVSEMFDSAKKSNVRATFIVPQNFSVSYLKRVLKTNEYDEFVYFYDIFGDELVGENEKILISMDMSIQPITDFIRKALKTSIRNFDRRLKKLCKNDIGDELDFAVASDPTASLGNQDFGYLEFITPINIVMPIYFMAVARTVDAFITERAQGLLERAWIAGVLPFEILISFVLSHMFVMFLQVLSGMFTVFVVFQLPCLGPIFWYAILVIVQGFAGLCNGFFFSTVCSKGSDAMLLATVATFLGLIACGGLWPLLCMEFSWMERLAWYFPHTATLQACRDITLRGWGLEATSVRHGLAISFGWSFIYFVASWALILKFQ